MDKPIADQSEYRPPTQSQNSNMFCVSIPKAATPFSFVLRAAKCLATSASPAPDFKNPSLAHCALAIASCVVNVFEAIKNKVVSGFKPFKVSAICVPSTFDTKCISSRAFKHFGASVTVTAPNSDPPFPLFTTPFFSSPVQPFLSPEWDL